MKTQIHLLEAHHGDSMIIETFDSNNEKFVILVDGGPGECFRTSLANALCQFSKIDLIILTHIDDDHVGGLIEFLNSDYIETIQVDKIIVNAGNLRKSSTGTQITYSQGVELEKILYSKFKNITILSSITSDKVNKLDLPDGIDITILSPNTEVLKLLYEDWPNIDLDHNEDTQICTASKYAKDFDVNFDKLNNEKDKSYNIKKDIFNASSIAFELKTKDFRGLFLGDANPKIVHNSLLKTTPNKFDYVKLSHHGSKYNISKELLDCISCDNYIISTNGGKGAAKHPDRECIAKIVKHPHNKDRTLNIIFNYPLDEIEEATGKLFNNSELKLFNYINKNLLNE